MNTVAYNKPLPVADIDTKDFWAGCKEHKLLIPKCTECGRYVFPPGPMCPECQSTKFENEEVEGKGVIYNWIIVNYSPHPEFVGDVPYAVIWVELDAPKRIILCGNIKECKNEDICAGMPVEVVFDDVTPETTLPQWKPVKK